MKTLFKPAVYLALQTNALRSRPTSRLHSSPSQHDADELDASSPFSFERDSSHSVQGLYQFLNEQECEGTENLAIGWTVTRKRNNHHDRPLLRGLFATQDFAAGEFLFAIPLPGTLLVQEKFIFDEASDPPPPLHVDQNKQHALQHGDEEIEQAMVFLEKFASEPFWKPYIDCLPRVLDDSSFDATPDFWTADALEKFPVPLMCQQGLERRCRIQRQADYKGKFSPSELQWAVWILRSRGFTSLQDTGGSLRERTILMPLIDMINHVDQSPNAAIEIIETDVYEESFVALQAQSSVAAGEEITLRYGTGFETSLELLDKYGFWTQGNPNDPRINWDLVDMDLLLAPLEHADENSQDASSATSSPSRSVVNRFCEHLKRQIPTQQ